MRLAEPVLVMLVARAMLHAEGVRDLADREAGLGAQLLQLARDGRGLWHGPNVRQLRGKTQTLFCLTMVRM